MKKGFLYLGITSVMLSSVVYAQEQTSNFYVGAGFGIVAVPDEEGFNFSDANNGFIQLGYKISENFAIEGQYSKSTKEASTDFPIDDIDVSEIWWEEFLRVNPSLTMNDAQNIFPYATMDLVTKLDASIETMAIYGTYRSSGDLYFKAKAGYLREDSTLTMTPESFDFYVAPSYNNEPIEFSEKRGSEFFDQYVGDVSEKVSESESGFSAGLGVGYKFNTRLFSELEYTALNEDLDFYSLSINYVF